MVSPPCIYHFTDLHSSLPVRWITGWFCTCKPSQTILSFMAGEFCSPRFRHYIVLSALSNCEEDHHEWWVKFRVLNKCQVLCVSMYIFCILLKQIIAKFICLPSLLNKVPLSQAKLRFIFKFQIYGLPCSHHCANPVIATRILGSFCFKREPFIKATKLKQFFLQGLILIN